jgi:cell wall-associated NlpC family hydrolase
MSNLQIDAVIAQAQGNIGYQEGAGNDNKFAATAKHPNHQPWCATFVVACFVKANALVAIKNTSSCIEMLKWGKSKKAVVDFKNAKRGDLILMNFSGSQVPEHIGIAAGDYDQGHNAIVTIEGNTSDSGSQANGDGVFRKIRPTQFVVAVIRPIWSN